MREIVILLPDIEPEQNVEIEVRINGRNKTLNYRVELMRLEGVSPVGEDRVTVLKRRISEYDRDWELVEIGAPSGSDIPLVFRKKPTTAGTLHATSQQ